MKIFDHKRREKKRALEHDDTHTPSDWRVFIQQYNQVAEEYASEPEIRESKLLAVAGLAVAAIQSSRRKRNA